MIAYRSPLSIYGSGPSVGEPAPPATRKPSERVEQIRFDPTTRRWYLTTSAGFSYDGASRTEVVLKAYDQMKLRDPTNPWSPPEAKQRGDTAVPTYTNLTVKDLQLQGKERKLKGWHAMTKGQLIEGLIQLDVAGAPTSPPLVLNPAEPKTEPAADGFDIPEFLRVTPEEAERRRQVNRNRPPEPTPRIVPDKKPSTPATTAAYTAALATARGTPPKGAPLVHTLGKRDGNHGRTIHILVRDNPKRPGSSAHTRYALYREGMTVAEFLAAGGTSADISFDQNKRFIELRNGKH